MDPKARVLPTTPQRPTAFTLSHVLQFIVFKEEAAKAKKSICMIMYVADLIADKAN